MFFIIPGEIIFAPLETFLSLNFKIFSIDFLSIIPGLRITEHLLNR